VREQTASASSLWLHRREQQPSQLPEDGRRQMYAETLWNRVRKWAEKNGYEYDNSYGVVGVAAT